MDNDTINKHTYSSAKIIAEYVKENELQKPEQAIFDILKSDLAGMRMLDIGIGAGRTSGHFINKVKSYTGIDYSEGMIQASRKRFKDIPSASLEVMDMRTGLKGFADNSFDFVLISFNSIDYIQYEERMVVLKEISRILAPGKLFCFSTHNINLIKNGSSLGIKDLGTPFGLMRKMYMKSVSINNRKQLNQVNTSYIIVNDGAHRFKLKTLYIDTIKQINDLKSFGFNTIRVFNSEGKEIPGSELEYNNEPFLYYLCSNTKDM
jgi:ubiquinone/menaquinone biosynthesis C-methylase UbiE